MSSYIFVSKIGPLCLEEKEGKLTGLSFASKAEADGAQAEPPAPLLAEAVRQLKDYFEGNLKKFSLPLEPEGTPFQQAVWRELLRIPYGATASYGEIARRVGQPGAARAVGLANNRNPIAIAIPCHRVVGANGKLVGYGGGLDLKKALLKLEGMLL